MNSPMTRRINKVLIFIVAVVAIHLLTIWAAPRLIMQVVMNGSRAQAMNMQNRAAFPAPITAASRDVVMPSPDLLYSMCVFDVSKGPVRVSANPELKSYWSIALYAANSDNFFVVNDRQAGGAPVDLWLVGPDTKSVAAPAGSKQVVSPSTIQQPRPKTVVDAAGHKQIVEVQRHYCLNPDCPYQTFTALPPGYLPHSPYPVQVRLLAVEVYAALLSTQRRSARMLGVSAATVYHWVAALSPAALCLAAYLGAVRTSGVVGLDDKWVRVCSPSAVRPHGQRPRAVWRYAYFAVDAYSSDLLALELYPEHNDQAVRLFLLELKAKGLSPRVVVSDLDPAYGRMLPLVFPQTVHHECLFHAIQNAFHQMTRVYGRHYGDTHPETVPLHTALTQLFQAQSQKTVRQRFAELQALRAEYVARTPDIACVFDSLNDHFPKLVNAIESATIPRTNNATELVTCQGTGLINTTRACAASTVLNRPRSTCGCLNSSIASRRSHLPPPPGAGWTTTPVTNAAGRPWNWLGMTSGPCRSPSSSPA